MATKSNISLSFLAQATCFYLLLLSPFGTRLSVTHATSVIVEVSTTAKPELSGNLKIVSVSLDTGSPVAHKVVHRHSNKRINISDRLHKFDLFIDPVCEQIAKLSEKQLSKISLQLKHFSSIVS